MSETKVPIRLQISGQAQVVSAFASVRNAASSLGNAIRGIAAPLGVAFSGAAVVGALREAINSADEMGKLAQRIGQTSENLSALAYAGELSDVSLEELSASLQKFNQWLSKTGQGARDAQQALEEQADVFARMPDGPAKTALAMELFGKAGAKLIPLLNGGRDGLREMSAEAQRLGLIIGAETAREAEEFNDNLTRLKANATGLARTLAKELLPSLTEITKTILAANAASGDGSGGSGFFGAIGNALSEQAKAGAQINAEFGGRFSGFFGTLLGGGGFLEAIQEGMKDGVLGVAEFRAELEKLNNTTKKGTDGEQRYAAALDDVKRRLEQSIASGQNRIASIEGDPSLSRIDRRAQLLEVYAEQLETVKALEADLAASMPADAQMFTDDAGNVRVTEEWLKQNREAIALTRQRVELMNQIDRLGPDPSSFRGQFELALGEMQDAWGTWAEQAAQSFRSIFGTVVGTLTDGITALIMRTQTWGEALRNIGTGILTGIVRAIVGMGVQWVATQVFMAVAGKAIQASAAAATVPIAAGAAAAWAPAATLATIATYGGAALSAPAFISGANAITAASSVGATLAGFARGGYTGDGPRDQVAGLVHRGEFVLTADAVERIGLPVLEAANAGASAGAAGASGQSVNVTLAAFDSRAEFNAWKDSQDSDVWFADMARRNAHRWGRRA